MKTQKPFPYPVYYWQMAGYTVLGLLASLYLVYTHYKNHTDIAFSSFCAVTQAVNCDTVAQSPWSVVLGLPIAVWGVFFYAALLLLLFPLRRRTEKSIPGWSLLCLIALLASCGSIGLAALSMLKIHSWCMLCVGTYLVNFLLTFTTWIMHRRFAERPFFASLPAAGVFFARAGLVKIGLPVLLLALIGVRLALPAYWEQEPEALNAEVATGLTAEGLPWIGAKEPRIVIEEYTDYMCFQCRKMHFYLRQLINRHPNTIRLVHRHYPLDHEYNPVLAPQPFHEGAGILALVAIAGAEKGRFWQVNDALYQAAQSEEKSIKLAPFAAMMGISEQELLGIMSSEKAYMHLRHDVLAGLKHKLTGTPGFVVDGQVYEKTLPPELLRGMMP